MTDFVIFSRCQAAAFLLCFLSLVVFVIQCFSFSVQHLADNNGAAAVACHISHICSSTAAYFLDSDSALGSVVWQQYARLFSEFKFSSTQHPVLIFRAAMVLLQRGSEFRQQPAPFHLHGTLHSSLVFAIGLSINNSFQLIALARAQQLHLTNR